jgi:hypothetical protein
MCSRCKTTDRPLLTRILPDHRSVVLCRSCFEGMSNQLELQLHRDRDSHPHHCRVGLQYQSLHPRLSRGRTH